VRDRPWDEAFRRGFRGFPIGRRFRVQPTWEEAQPRKREVLWLNPSRAFGTGTHATTQLALECLEDYLVSGASLIDVGTGTGILAMAAARLGAMPVLAIDCDPDAVFCARENVVRNQLAGRVEIRQANLRRFRPAPARAVVANLSEPLLRDTLRRIASWVDSPGFLIASGFLCEQAQTLVERTPGGMVLLEERIRGEWAALVWRKG
jgi:ribosomal protein L11 methyltransferase